MGQPWVPVAVLFAVVIVVTVLAAVWSAVQQKRRARMMAEAAQALGFSFEPEGAGLLDEGVTDISFFNLAALGSGKISNLMRGQRASCPLAICDYHYWTGTAGRGRRDRRQTVICFDVRGARVPDFSLVPRRGALEQKLLAAELELVKTPREMLNPAPGELKAQLLNTVIAAVKEKGIELPSDPEFSKLYHLRAPDPQAVQALFDPGMVELLREQRKPLLSIEKAGRWMVVYRKGVPIPPDRIEDGLAEATELGSRLIR